MASLEGGDRDTSSALPLHRHVDSVSIYARCKTCLDRYLALSDALSASTPEAATEIGFQQETSLADVEDAYVRFKAWAINIAAFQQSHLPSSLDSRLKEATEIRQRILKILADLEVSLQTAWLIVTGVEPNEKWDIGSISDSDEEDGQQSKGEAIETSELEELFSAIQTANSSLMKLSIVIRTSPTRDDYLKAASRYNLDSVWDIGHVKEKHGKSKRKQDWLLDRLGKSITRRRQYLRYREDHHWKLAQDWDNVPKEEPGQEAARTLAHTKATTFVEVKALPGQDDSDFGGSFGSQTSYDPTVMGESESVTKLTVPKPPKMAFEGVMFTYGEPFQCPYCYTEQTVKNKTAWKKHVFRDLKPYVCTFKECDLKMFKSRNEWFAHELQNHRREWICPSCPQSFHSRSTFQSHLTSAHRMKTAGSELEALILQSEEPVDRVPVSACMLCDDWETSLLSSGQDAKRSFLNDGASVEPYVTLGQFRRHLGRHMEQLALFALPMHEDEGMDDDSAAGSDSENDAEAEDARLGAFNQTPDMDSTHAQPVTEEDVAGLQKSLAFDLEIQKERLRVFNSAWEELLVTFEISEIEEMVINTRAETSDILDKGALVWAEINSKTEPDYTNLLRFREIMYDLKVSIDKLYHSSGFLDASRGGMGIWPGASTTGEMGDNEKRMPEVAPAPAATKQISDTSQNEEAELANNASVIEESNPRENSDGDWEIDTEDIPYTPSVAMSRRSSLHSSEAGSRISSARIRSEMVRDSPLYGFARLCEICKPPKAFNREADLSRHVQEVHTTPYSCTFEGCERVFHLPGRFTNHLNQHYMEGLKAQKLDPDFQPPLESTKIMSAEENDSEVDFRKSQDDLPEYSMAYRRRAPNSIEFKRAATDLGYPFTVVGDDIVFDNMLSITQYLQMTASVGFSALGISGLAASGDAIPDLHDSGTPENAGEADHDQATRISSGDGDGDEASRRVVKIADKEVDDPEPAPVEASDWIFETDRKKARASKDTARAHRIPQREDVVRQMTEDDDETLLPAEGSRSRSKEVEAEMGYASSLLPEREASETPQSKQPESFAALSAKRHKKRGERDVESQSTSTEHVAPPLGTTSQSQRKQEANPFHSSAVPKSYAFGYTPPSIILNPFVPYQPGNSQPEPAYFESSTGKVREDESVRENRYEEATRKALASLVPTQRGLLDARAEDYAALRGELEKEFKEERSPSTLIPDTSSRKSPIHFTDAVGRKFSFPFHLVCTWSGMEELIKQAFLHVDIIGPHVADGHYDLIGPNGEIILPQVWEALIEPGWKITMHMWPMPEPKPMLPSDAKQPPEHTKKTSRKTKKGAPSGMFSWSGAVPKKARKKSGKESPYLSTEYGEAGNIGESRAEELFVQRPGEANTGATSASGKGTDVLDMASDQRSLRQNDREAIGSGHRRATEVDESSQAPSKTFATIESEEQGNTKVGSQPGASALKSQAHASLSGWLNPLPSLKKAFISTSSEAGNNDGKDV